MSATAAGVDVGGTFTDVVVLSDGVPRALKVPSNPEDQAEGVRRGLDAWGGGMPEAVAHGTTTATNAVLERRVARTVLVTTQGFADVLTIGRQHRPSLYDLTVVRPEPLVSRDDVVTVSERTAADGSVLVDLSAGEIERVVAAVAARQPEAVAVSLLFSYAGPAHERALCVALRDRLEVPVTRSSDLLPEFREYERASTCVLNAAVAPVMSRYLTRLADRLRRATGERTPPRITVMTSGGGTVDLAFAAAAPVHTLLSGPAAGVVAAGAVAQSAGFPDAVALDMGGTSTDVCLIRNARPHVTAEGEIAGLPFRTPTVDVHTVGAGGGSIASIDAGGALRVGPRSAGARPGPACYGLGGTRPTVTDAHCALGHLDPDRPLGGGALRLDAAAARRALGTLPDDVDGHGILTVVRATMGRALRKVTTERGVDPAELALVAYGGAGPLHATALARDLGCRAVVVPPAPGVLSALGLLLAPPRYEATRTVMASGDAPLEPVWIDLEQAAATKLEEQGAAVAGLVRQADVRYRGQSHELRVDAPPGGDLQDHLHAAHQRAYGYAMRGEPVEVVTVRVVAHGMPALDGLPHTWRYAAAAPRPEQRRAFGVAGRLLEGRVLDRAGLRPGDAVDGPALIEQADTTTLLGPGDRGHVDDRGNLVVVMSG